MRFTNDSIILNQEEVQQLRKLLGLETAPTTNTTNFYSKKKQIEDQLQLWGWSYFWQSYRDNGTTVEFCGDTVRMYHRTGGGEAVLSRDGFDAGGFTAANVFEEIILDIMK